MGFPGGVKIKNPSANAGDTRDSDLIPASGRSLGEGNGNLLQYSSPENSMDRGAWWAPVYGITKNWIQLSTHTHTHTVMLQLFSVWKDPVLKSRRSNKGTSIQKHGDLTANTIGWVRSKDEEHIESSEEMVTSGRMQGGQTSRKGPLDSDKVKK